LLREGRFSGTVFAAVVNIFFQPGLEIWETIGHNSEKSLNNSPLKWRAEDVRR
jgi:hypothetical protein